MGDSVSCPLISVVIPIYNVEKYLNRCIHSVLAQTYFHLEVILVDDGSPDHCSVMCDEWARQDQRVRVVHKTNGGLSSARNAGIDAATGKYLLFIDGDDFWMQNDFLTNAVEILEVTNDNVLLFGYKEIKKNSEIAKVDFSCIEDTDKSYSGTYCVKHNLLFSSACTKIVKTDFIKKRKIYFRKNVHSEDVEWTAKILALNNRYSVYPKNVYGYFQHKSSITHNISEGDVETLTQNIRRCLDITKTEVVIDAVAFYNYIAYQYITILNLYVLFARKNKNIYMALKENRWLLNYHLNKKVQLVYLCDKYFGFSFMVAFLHLFLKLKKSGR